MPWGASSIFIGRAPSDALVHFDLLRPQRHPDRRTARTGDAVIQINWCCNLGHPHLRFARLIPLQRALEHVHAADEIGDKA
jgi:hypothetical protein